MHGGVTENAQKIAVTTAADGEQSGVRQKQGRHGGLWACTGKPRTCPGAREVHAPHGCALDGQAHGDSVTTGSGATDQNGEATGNRAARRIGTNGEHLRLRARNRKREVEEALTLGCSALMIDSGKTKPSADKGRRSRGSRAPTALLLLGKDEDDSGVADCEVPINVVVQRRPILELDLRGHGGAVGREEERRWRRKRENGEGLGFLSAVA